MENIPTAHLDSAQKLVSGGLCGNAHVTGVSRWGLGEQSSPERSARSQPHALSATSRGAGRCLGVPWRGPDPGGTRASDCGPQRPPGVPRAVLRVTPVVQPQEQVLPPGAAQTTATIQ